MSPPLCTVYSCLLVVEHRTHIYLPSLSCFFWLLFVCFINVSYFMLGWYMSFIYGSSSGDAAGHLADKCVAQRMTNFSLPFLSLSTPHPPSPIPRPHLLTHASCLIPLSVHQDCLAQLQANQRPPRLMSTVKFQHLKICSCHTYIHVNSTYIHT